MEENNVQEIQANEVVIPQKKYTFRKLIATDIGLMTSLIKKIGVNKVAGVFQNEDIRKAMSSKDDDLMMTVGIAVVTVLIQIIVEAYDQCEADLHKLLSKTSNLSEEEVKQLEMDEFFEMLFDFFKKDEFMGISDGKIICCEKDPVESAKKLLDRMIDDDSAIVTLLYGEATSKEEAEELAAYIEDKYTIEVELHNGGQPVYNYIFGVE